MRVLIVHNHYQQPGGEDVVVAQETALLRAYGHEVIEYRCSNTALASMPLHQKALLPQRVIWSQEAYRDLHRLIATERPDLAHVHNTLFLISPAVYYACHAQGVPVVQTVHNYRLLCPNALFLREGRICEDCLGKMLPWPGIVHACYHSSRVQTGVIALMLATHHWLKTWQRQVDIYIALTEFARQKLIQGGFRADKIVVKPNFVHPDPGCGDGPGEYALFVGRLSPEKGIETVLRAWQLLTDIPLKIVGDGPLMAQVRAYVQDRQRADIDVLGQQPPETVIQLLRGARFLLFPSETYETFGRSVIEAFACGVPVIVSRLGAMAELVADGGTGLYVQPGDPADLAAKAAWLWQRPEQAQQMGRAARQEYTARYTASQNYDVLMDVYERARHMSNHP